jgi:hypothetical protein
MTIMVILVMKALKAYKDKTGNVAEIKCLRLCCATGVKRQSCISEHDLMGLQCFLIGLLLIMVQPLKTEVIIHYASDIYSTPNVPFTDIKLVW